MSKVWDIIKVALYVAIGVSFFALGWAHSQEAFASNKKEEITAPCYNIEEDKDAIDMLRSYKTLSAQDRIILGSKIADDQATRLGLSYKLNVKASDDLPDGVGALYSHSLKQITLQAAFLDTLSLEEFLADITHEAAHSQQDRLIELFHELDADAENIIFTSNDSFSLVAQYTYELLNYASCTVDDSAYARQSVERVANIWAIDESRYYLDLIEGFRTIRPAPEWPVTLEPKTDQRVEAIRDYLKSINSHLYPYFSLTDLTGDDFAEVILISGSSHLNGVRFVTVNEAGEITTSPEIGSFGKVQYSPETKTFLAKYGNQGWFWSYPFVFDDGQLALLSSVFLEDRSKEEEQLYIDSLKGDRFSISYDALFDRSPDAAIEVDQETFQKAFEEVFGKDELITLPGDTHIYMMNEKEIDQALKTVMSK